MEINKGLVIRLIAGEYKVYDLNTKQIINAKPRGVMRIKSSAPKVGDYVDIVQEDGTPVILWIVPVRPRLLPPNGICE